MIITMDNDVTFSAEQPEENSLGNLIIDKKLFDYMAKIKNKVVKISFDDQHFYGSVWHMQYHKNDSDSMIISLCRDKSARGWGFK